MAGRGATAACLVGLLLVALVSPGQAFHPGHECGVSHPHIQAEIAARGFAVVPQEYHTHPGGGDAPVRAHDAHEDHSAHTHDHVHGHVHAHEEVRVLEDQDYATTGAGGFLPLATAHSQGLTGPLRIHVVWDVVEGGDYTGANSGTNAKQCIAAGATVQVTCQNGAGTCAWNGCADEDVVSAGHPKLALMQKRVAWVQQYLGAATTVKQVQNNITLRASTVNNFQLSTTTVADADLVVIMTARPEPFRNLAGYAYCDQRDQHNRCTVGVFNWVPKVLSVVDQDLPANVASERHTAVHEVIHILGGIFANGPFIDEAGNAKASGVYVVERDSVGYNKPATKIVTPKVLDVIRDQFGCAAMSGMPIEDQTTGRGAHWEARLMGPEVMSYGTGTGEVYMSDLTFAYLEDTNQYLMNYSHTGPLVDAVGDTSEDTNFEVDTRETPTQAFGPGYLRWGRGQGCDFVNGNAKDWSDRYFCSTHREFTCSFDNRMSAVCDIRTNWQLSSQYTCGTFESGTTWCDRQLNDNCDASRGCLLPSIYQHFTPQEAVTAAGAGATSSQTGGFSSAMDYVPVRIGYWNCQNTAPEGNASSQLANEGVDVDLDSLTGGTEEQMRLFGGQAYCKNCRCFVSSLMEFSSGSVNPNFPRFGLCYRSNCFRSNYLQFAIQDQIGGDVTWYKCPSGGGKLYIAGFSGAFHCPVATDFCQFEEITGIKYEETTILWEWIVSSLFFVLPVLTVLVCLCCGHTMAERVKTAIGVHFFENPSENDHLGREIPPECPSRMLLVINACSFMVGITLMMITFTGIASGRVSAAASLLISFSSFVIFVSCLGGCGATRRAKGASCVLLTYFYFVLFCAAGYFFFACWAWIYTEAFDEYISRHWNTVVDALPSDILNRQADAETSGGTVADNQLAAAVVALVILLSISLAIVGSVMIISMPVLMATLFMVANYSFVFTGIVIIAVGAYAATFAAGFGTNVMVLIALFICLGLYIAINALIGLVGGFKRSLSLLKLALAMSLLSLFLQVSAAAGLFINSDAMANLMDNLNDEDAARFTEKLGMTGLSQEELEDTLQNNVRAMALASLCWIATLIVSIITNIYFIAALRKRRRQIRIQMSNKVGPDSFRGRRGSQDAWR